MKWGNYLYRNRNLTEKSQEIIQNLTNEQNMRKKSSIFDPKMSSYSGQNITEKRHVIVSHNYYPNFSEEYR